MPFETLFKLTVQSVKDDKGNEIKEPLVKMKIEVDTNRLKQEMVYNRGLNDPVQIDLNKEEVINRVLKMPGFDVTHQSGRKISIK